jgi:hypothetical protein
LAITWLGLSANTLLSARLRRSGSCRALATNHHALVLSGSALQMGSEFPMLPHIALLKAVDHMVQ